MFGNCFSVKSVAFAEDLQNLVAFSEVFVSIDQYFQLLSNQQKWGFQPRALVKSVALAKNFQNDVAFAEDF